MTPEQFDRLPKYAQLELQRLQRNLEAAYARLDEGPATSPIVADPHSAQPRRLGSTRSARFHLGEPGERPYFDATIARGELRVTGVPGMVVRPHAGNVVMLVPS